MNAVISLSFVYHLRFLDPVIAVALLASFVVYTVEYEKSDWYKFGRESLMLCFVEVSEEPRRNK